jgi:hypothetical protein
MVSDTLFAAISYGFTAAMVAGTALVFRPSSTASPSGCTSNGDCVVGLVCVDGSCVTCSSVSESCSAQCPQGVCPPGYICGGMGVCTTAPNVLWNQITGLPFVTVSPVGTAQGLPTNNGANYGPDTPGTQTDGLQEAIDAISNSTGSSSTGGGGLVQLLAGAPFRPSVPIVLYPGVMLKGLEYFPRSVAGSPTYTLTGIPSIQPTGTGDTIQTTQYPEGGTENVTNASITVIGLEVYGTGSPGSSAIHMSNTDHCAVVGCDVKSCYNGITFDVISPTGAGEGGYSTISNNSIATYDNYGVYNLFNTQMRIVDNQFDAPNPGAVAAILSQRSNTTIITNNIVQGVIQPGMAGIWLDELVSDPTSNTLVTGNIVVGGAGTNTVGIKITGDSQTLIDVTGNHINAVTTPIVYPMGMTKSQIVNNNGFNPAGFTIPTPAVPASGTALANEFPFPVVVYFVTVGDVTGYTITDPSGKVAAFAAPPRVGESLLLGPQDTITLHYTTAPTWMWYGT